MVSTHPRTAALGRTLLLLHLLLSPLLFSQATAEAFEFPKIMLLHLVAILLGALGLSHLAGNWDLTVRVREIGVRLGRAIIHDPLALAVLLYLASAIVSTIFSISPRTSVQGAPESEVGLLTILAYAILFFATRALCRSMADVHRLLAVAVLAAAVASAHALIQVVGADPIAWQDLSVIGTLTRPFGPMGHPNLLAAYLVMAFPITALYALRAKASRRWGILVILLTLLIASGVVIVLSLSRGAWLAFVGMLVALVAGWARVNRRHLVMGLAALAIAVGAGLTLLDVGQVEGRANVVRQRLQALVEAGPRRQIWQAGLAVFRDHPICGCGLDAFGLAFPAKRSPAYWRLEWNVTPVKAHNELIHLLATQGILGLIAALVALVGVGLAVGRAVRVQGADHRLELAAVGAALVGFGIQAMFSFTVAATGTLLVTLVAVLSRLSVRADSKEEDRASERWFAPALLAGALLVAVSYFFHFRPDLGEWISTRRGACVAILTPLGLVVVALVALCGRSARLVARSRPQWSLGRLGIQTTIWTGALLLSGRAILLPVQASIACQRGEQILPSDPTESRVCLEHATALAPGNDQFWAELAGAAQTCAEREISAARRQILLLQARRALERASRLVPANAYHHAHLGQACGLLAREGLATADEALRECNRAIALDPVNVYFRLQAAQVALDLGDRPRAGEYAAAGLHVFGDFAPLRAVRAEAAFIDKDWAEAERRLREAITGDWHGDEEGKLRAAARLTVTLLELHRGEEALSIAQYLITRRPASADAHLLVGRALELLGRAREAEQEYRQVRALLPPTRTGT